MRRAWAVMITAATLASCRTAQPTTNPFLRTTVPPPATTPGVVVTPGTPYAQGISPPMVTTPAPAITAPPPVTTTPVPVQPAPAVAPLAAPPPPVVPQGDRFNPPGGSYLYHQSSHEMPAAKAELATVKLASATESDRIVVQACYAPPDDRLDTVMTPDGFIENPYVKRARKVENPSAISRDGYIENPYVKARPKLAELPPAAATRPVTKAPAELKAPPGMPAPKLVRPTPRITAPPVASKAAKPATRLRVESPPPQPLPNLPSKVTVNATSEGNRLRILGESKTQPSVAAVPPKPTSAGQQMRLVESQSASESVVLKITAGSAQPSLRATMQEPVTDPPGVAMKMQTGDGSTASFVEPAATERGVVRATFQPAQKGSQTPHYAHTPDYQRLRGRLEYSQSQRQWKLRYIPIDGQTDDYGGSVVLPSDAMADGFQPGDFVEIEGVLTSKTASRAGFAPGYDPRSIVRLAR